MFLIFQQKMIQLLSQNVSFSINIQRDRIYNIISKKFNNYFNDLKRHKNYDSNKKGISLKASFKKYIEKCLKLCVILHHFHLKLFPTKFNYFTNGIFKYNNDIMIKELLENQNEGKNVFFLLISSYH